MKPTRPLVYYAAALYLSCIVYIFSTESIFLGAALTASFLMIILFTIEKKISIIIILFYIFGIVSNLFYYNANYFGNLEKIKIVKLNSFYGIGTIRGRNLILNGNLKDISEGEYILAKGIFKDKKDYYSGLVGDYYIEKVQDKYKNTELFFAGIKEKAYIKLTKGLGKEKAALIMSICYGDTKHITEEQKYKFQRLGVVHAISVSGFHMAVIYKLLEGLLGMWASIAVSFFYVIFTGSQPATIRAFIMILVLKLSKKVFRSYDALSSLCLSSILILTVKPFYALDLGFILSYLSTLGIILYYNKIRRALYKLPSLINESLSLTLSAQTFSMAYAAMSIGNISFGFIPGNLLLLPMYSFLVVLGNIVLLFLKVDIIFNILCKVIYASTIMVDGAHYLLLVISPPISYLTFVESMAILLLISSFILVKNGFVRFKAVPAYIFIIVIMQYYSFFPSFKFINIGNEELVLIKYRSKSILIHDNDISYSKDYDIIDKRFFIKNVLTAEEGLTLRLNDNCLVIIHTNSSESNNSIALEVKSSSINTLITRKIEQNKDVDLKKYDIIKLPAIEPFTTVYGSGRIRISSYKLVQNKVLAAVDLTN